MILGIYNPTCDKLLENQWLLKFHENEEERIWDGKTYIASGSYKTGFLTKLTKKGELPKPFLDWAETLMENSESSFPFTSFRKIIKLDGRCFPGDLDSLKIGLE
jgi:hypothetical protein